MSPLLGAPGSTVLAHPVTGHPHVEVPTLLLHGSEDTLVPPAMSEALGGLIEGSRRVVVEGRDHNTLWEAPSQVLAEVVAFVRELAG